ncbi:unnamed protein product, partial [Didymodactylos carnosus]
CLNLSRPTTSANSQRANTQQKQNERVYFSSDVNSGDPYTRKSGRKSAANINKRSVPIRGQLKIDLYNFDHYDFQDSKYVLTSPRSLEACCRLNIKPVTLLPKRLADVQDDIGSEKVRLSTLADVRDEMEIDRLAKLQRCREEREKIIKEETHDSSDIKDVTVEPSIVNQGNPVRFPQTKFTPSSALISGISQPTTVHSSSMRPYSATNDTKGTNLSVKFADNLYPRRSATKNDNIIANSILKSSLTKWPTEPSNIDDYFTYDEYENINDKTGNLSRSSSFVHDMRKMSKSLQNINMSENMSKQTKNEKYMNGLERVKDMLERRVTQSGSDPTETETIVDKKYYELLLGHYDHEIKIQRALENARRNEKEKEKERYETLLRDFLEQTLADERREKERRRKTQHLHQSRQLYETLQHKNYEQNINEQQMRRYELLNSIKRKNRKTQSFLKEKQDTVNLSRSLAKSSQDIRELLHQSGQTFDQMAKKAELTSSILITKPKTIPITRKHLQTSIVKEIHCGMGELPIKLFDCPEFAEGKYCQALCALRHHTKEEKDAIAAYRALQASGVEKTYRKLGPVFIVAGPEKAGTSWLFNAIRLLLMREKSPWGPPDSYRLNHIYRNDLETRLQSAEGRPLVVRTMRIPEKDWNENLDRIGHGYHVFVAHRDLRDIIDDCLSIGWMKHDLAVILTRLKSYVEAFEDWRKNAKGDFRFEHIQNQPVEQLKHLARLMNIACEHGEQISKEINSLRPGQAIGPDPVTKMWPSHRVVETKAHGDDGKTESNVILTNHSKLSDTERKKIRDTFEDYHDRYAYI